MTEAQKIAAFDALPVVVVAQIVEYADEAAARAALWEAVADEDCVDNYRFAFADDAAQVAAFEEASRDGCCGSYERDLIVAGRPAMIGCNYGH